MRAALLLVAVAAVGGCASNGPVAQQPPPLASLLQTQTPTPTPSASGVGAIDAAVRSYVAGLNKALRTGNTSAAVAVTTPGCDCRKQLKAIAGVYAKHDRLIGIQLVAVTVTSVAEHGASGTARLTYRVPAGQVEHSDGRRTAVKAEPMRTVLVQLVLVSGRWLLSAVG